MTRGSGGGGPVNRVLAGLFWLALYLLAVVGPAVLMLVGPAPPVRSFGLELAVVLGFMGLAQIGLQFVLIARFQALTWPYGIDTILQYHRQIGFLSLALVAAHVVILGGARPAVLAALVRPGSWNAALSTGVGALISFVLLVVLSVARTRLGIGYEAWRVGHALLGILALLLALAHVLSVGGYANAPWKRAGWIAFTVLVIAVLGTLRIVRPLLESRRPYRVVGVEPDRGSTWIVALEPDGHPGVPIGPGQFVWLKLGGSPWSLQEHPFSFSSSAERPERLEFGIKELGDFTGRIGDVEPGTPATIDGPHGSLSIDRYPAAGYVFIAGGIGITPIVSMLKTMADRGDRRPALLVYADDSWDRMPFRDDLAALEDRMSLDVVHVLEEPHEGWTGEVGLVDAGLLERHLPADYRYRDFFICGPNPMIGALEHHLEALGVSSWKVHSERFNLV